MIGNTNTASPNPAVKVEMEERTFTLNGDYTPSQGYFGFNPIHIRVNTGYDVVAAYVPNNFEELSDNAKVILNPTTAQERMVLLQDWKIAKPTQSNFTNDSLVGYVVGTKKVDSKNNSFYNVKTLLDTNT